MARPLVALAAALAVLLLAVAGAGGAATQQAPKRGGTVVYGGPFAEPACFTPFLERCAPGASWIARQFISHAVLREPMELAPDLGWRSFLVSHVEFTRKPPYTLTYHIRPEARWSDGVPITSRDFQFTVRAAQRLHIPRWFSDPEVFDSMHVVDPKTFRIVVRTRFAGWRNFDQILPAHALAGEDLTNVWTDRIDNPKTGEAIGSGPFLIERWERGKQITLRRNPRYWGSHPAYLDRLVVRFQVSGTMLAESFRGGELDAASHFPLAVFDSLEREPDVRVSKDQRAVLWDHLGLRLGPGGHPALGSKLVRRALAYGLDRDAIVRRVLGGGMPGAEPRNSVFFAPHSRYYRPNWRIYQRRPAESRRLLAQAGCERGADGIHVCAGRRLSLRLVTTPDPTGVRARVIPLLQAQLRAVGVELVPTFATNPALFGGDGILARGDFDIVLFGWGLLPEDTFRPIFGCQGEINYTGYCQRLFTADLDQAERILDAAQRARVLNRADAQLAKDVPVLPLYNGTQSVAVRSTLRNFGLASVTQLNPLWNVENWWLASER